MVKYIGKLGTVVVGLIIITRLDFGRSSFHLAANVLQIGGRFNAANVLL